MGSGLILLLLAVAVGGFAYFVTMWTLYRVSLRNATATERYAYQVESDREDAESKSLKARFVERFAAAGWTGSIAPVLLATAFLYTIVVVVFSLTAIPEIAAIILGLPTCVALTLLILNRIQARRRRLFQAQLMQALGMLASQIEAGNGPQRALEQIIPSLENPLGAEFAEAVASTVVVKDLVEAIRPVAERYPSRAMTLFVAALEVDRLQGGSLAPTLRQAQSMLARSYELAEETAAEISQAKSEFYAIVGIVLFMAFGLLTGGDESTRSSYFSPTGMVVLGVGFANFGLGIFRSLRIFSKVKGDTL